MNDSQPVTAPTGPSGQQRGVRDWIVDTLLFLCAAGLGVIAAESRVTSATVPSPEWLFFLDQVVGALGCCALWLRRRWPVQLAVVLLIVSSVSELIGGASVVALFTVAVHRPMRTAFAIFGLGVVTSVIFNAVRPDPTISFLWQMALALAIQGGLLGWGLFIRHRRQLIVELKDRAVRAETEAHLRAEQAQHQAREEIAREIHDVLGHRLSLLSVHAGALAYRPDAPTADIARAAEIIRESAHDALQDLREVVGVLRAPVGELLPQPKLDDVGGLVAESERAGMAVTLEERIDAVVPETAGRTAYRIVQEGLTNARKHAPGAAVTVLVTGAPGGGLNVEVINAAPTGPPVPGPSSGQGLAGLAERVSLAGGRMEHGRTGVGGWRVCAWLPWPA